MGMHFTETSDRRRETSTRRSTSNICIAGDAYVIFIRRIGFTASLDLAGFSHVSQRYLLLLEWVHARATSHIHRHLDKLTQAFGNDRGETITIGGLSGVVGDPDMVWVTGEFMKPKFVMESKIPWAFSVTGSKISEYKNNSAEVVKAIQQLYGYLTFNDLRHGALSTYNVTWFFRQTYSSNGKEPQKLFGAYIKILRLADVDGSHQRPRRVPVAALVATL